MAGQGSARVTLNEIDLSQVRDPEQLPQGVPAAVVGPAKRGPAFVPKTFATIQQFNETFGSLQEVSKESNANRFGPLALNEWMRNAQAGTFLRVLGVGDGNAKASNGRVTDAGFVVGDNTTYDSNNELQRNPNASGLTANNEVAALKTARTHFLGCFMKDQGDSTFLQDAGIQSDSASGQLDITFSNVPNANDFLLLTGVSATASKVFKVTFTAENDNIIGAAAQGSAHDVDIIVGIDGLNATTLATALFNALKGLNRAEADLGADAAINPATYFTVTNPTNGQVVVTQVGTGVSSNTPGSFNITSDVTVVGDSTKTKSDVSQTVASTVSGAQSASSVVTVSADPQANGLCSFTITDSLGIQKHIRISLGDDNGLTADGVSVVEGITIDYYIGVFSITGNNSNIADKIATELQTLVDDSIFEGLTFTGNNNGTFSIDNSLAGAVDLFTEIQDTADALSEVGDNGSNGSKSTITLDINGLPAVDNEFTLNTVDESTNAASDLTFKFVAESATEPGSLNGTVDNGKVQIELNQNIDIFLTRIQSAIEVSSVNDKYTVIVDASADTVLIRRTQDQGFVQDRNFVFKLGENISVIGSTTVLGNFGPKSISFAGGGGGAAPVVRGILMSPQGVIPALKTANASYTSSPTDAQIRKLTVDNDTDLLSFGSNANTNLIGYQLGTVTVTDEQSFEVVLNGFKSDVDSAVLTCSFNPESPNYFAKVMNTDPEKIEERGHYLHAHWDIDPAVAKADKSGVLSESGELATNDMLGFCIHSVGDRAEENLVGGVSTLNTPDFESFDSRFRTARSPWIMSQKSGGTSRKLFRLHSLDDGEAGNDRFRIMISNIRAGETDSDFGFFDLTLEAFDSDPISGEKLIQWNSLSLNPDDKNYIARVIGDKHMYYDFDRSQSKQRLVEEGDYEVRNRFVRVEVSVDVETADGASWARAALPCGFKEYKTLNLAPRTGLFDELGTDGSGTNRLLPEGSFDSLKVLPLPFVKHITRKSGLTTETSEALAWGVKFAKKQKAAAHQEIGEIRFNPSIVSWTKFFPDMGSSPFAIDAAEEFSLEHIAVDNASSIDWSTSEYVRDGSTLPARSSGEGNKQFVQLSEAAKSGRNVRFLKFRCMMQGGFDGLNIFNKEKAAMSSVAAFREANEEVADSNIFTGPTIAAYKRAIDVLADKSATEFQLLAIPGMREPLITDYAITACESRFDAMFVMDIQECDRLTAVILDDTKPSVNKTISNFTERRLDTSFAAAYFPDVIMRRPSNGSPLQVPPSVGMLGVMSLNDTLADPWFAPAGLRRGRLAAQNVKVQMNRDTLNDLYDADINPIYEPAGRAGEVYAFGQKTLLQNQSALDRINVRRLLINIRRQVKAVANTLLFEPNRASTLAKFNALVEPIMSNVQARQGVDRYKVQIDTTTTTENDVLNNTIRGKIYLQPTKSVEFISLDFVVTNSID